MRLRKMWRSPATIFLDHMIIDKDVQVYTNCEMYIEILKGKKSCSTGLHIIFCKFS